MPKPFPTIKEGIVSQRQNKKKKIAVLTFSVLFREKDTEKGIANTLAPALLIDL